MTDINLKAFCSTDKGRQDLQEPFSAGDFTYASNGHVAVRVPRLSEYAEVMDHRKVKTIDSWFARDVTFSPFPAVVLPTVAPHVPKPCKDCNATGRIHSTSCSKCSGSGLHKCYACNNENDCEACDGYGYIERPATTEDDPKKVSDCGNCDGTGDCSTSDDRLIFTRVGPYWIDRRYVVLIQTLPGLELDLGHAAYYDGATKWDDPPILFRFDGGVGAIMPLRGPVPKDQRASQERSDAKEGA